MVCYGLSPLTRNRILKHTFNVLDDIKLISSEEWLKFSIIPLEVFGIVLRTEVFI